MREKGRERVKGARRIEKEMSNVSLNLKKDIYIYFWWVQITHECKPFLRNDIFCHKCEKNM